MSKYTTLATGWNNNRHRVVVADPAPELVLSGVWPAVVSVPGLADFHAAVVVLEGDEKVFYVGKDAFTSSEEAHAVAVARARARMESAS